MDTHPTWFGTIIFVLIIKISTICINAILIHIVTRRTVASQIISKGQAIDSKINELSEKVDIAIVAMHQIGDLQKLLVVTNQLLDKLNEKLK